MKRITTTLGMLLILAVGIGGIFLAVHNHFKQSASSIDPFTPAALTFHGSSRDLKRSVVVPTLDTPMPEGKNVIWCGSFQMAWNRLRDDVVREPVRLANAESVAKRLNGSLFSESDLASGSCYAAAGYVKEGVINRIRQEMQRRFHKEPHDLADARAALVAYGYLQAQVPFTIPYLENTKPFLFIDSTGCKTAVASFGLREEDEYAYDRLREQFESLYVLRDGDRRNPAEFAIDPCKDSKPNQVVIACIPRKGTLRAMLDDLERKIMEHSAEGSEQRLDCNAKVLIPSMHWNITHHFKELEGQDKRLQNQGFDNLWLDTALQTIDFRLDRGGVELQSEAKVVCEPIAVNYIINRPYLIVVRKRGSQEPFFVMWVDNAELLAQFATDSADSRKTEARN